MQPLFIATDNPIDWRHAKGRVIDGKKLCITCSEVQDVSNFPMVSPASGKKAARYAAHCKSCVDGGELQKSTKHGRKPRQEHGEIHEKYCSGCEQTKPVTAFAKISQRNQALRSDPYASQCSHCRKLKRLYSMTSKEYDVLLASQHGVCAICGKTNASNKRKHLMVDHDHATGEVRGLLCNGCNTGLGGFRDNIQFMHRAIQYINLYSS